MKFCLVNGIQQNHIDIESRGLAYGDGLFTTAKIINGNIQYLAQHIDRLIIGSKRLGITPPSSTHLTQQLTSTSKNYALAVLKVIISAKAGGRGYARVQNNDHDLTIMVHDYPKHYDEQVHHGLALGLSEQKLGLNPMLAGLKHLNRLEQVLLREELSSRAEDDLLVTNLNNDVISATSANVFVSIDEKIYTPDLTLSGINGIMRQVVLQHYPSVIVKALSLNEIAQAQAMFICNSVMGVMPIAKFNGRLLSIDFPLAIRDAINNQTIAKKTKQ